MIVNYFKSASRNLWKDKFFSLINIIGLAISITITIVIAQILFHEWSYDKFHENKKDIYRLINYNSQNSYPGFSSKLGQQLALEDPSVKSYARVYRDWSTTIKNPRNPTYVHVEKGFVFVDPSFFSIFTFPLHSQSLTDVLSKPFTVIISETMANKYFGRLNPIGEKIIYNGNHTFEVVDIVKDVPSNSTISFDFISSIETLEKINKFSYDNLPNFETFLLIRDKFSTSRIERNAQLINELISPLNYNKNDQIKLESLKSLRFDSKYSYNEKASLKSLYVLFLLAVFILSLSLFNYINLSTARASLRAKEVGVRKTIGATQFNLAKQFFLESTLITTFSFLLSIALVILSRNFFNSAIGINIDINVLSDKYFFLLVAMLFSTITLAAGMYPAFILSGFSPIDAFTSKVVKTSRGRKSRSVMIVLQFCISGLLITCSLIMYKQITYIENRDLGFNRKGIVTLTLSPNVAAKSESFKEAIMRQTGIKNISLSDTPFFKTYAVSKFKSKENNLSTDLVVLQTDANFVKNMKIDWMVEPDHSFNNNNYEFIVAINEKAVKKLGYMGNNAVGQELLNEQGQIYGRISGIIKNFNFTSPQLDIQPTMLLVRKSNLLFDGYRNMQIRFNKNQSFKEHISLIKTIYQKYDSESPFRYSFIEDDFQKTFVEQSKIIRIIHFLTIVAVSLACMGLFGLVTFVGRVRSKEIIIRKVMGASLLDIIFTLSKEFLILVVISIIISIPFSYYFMQQWLKGFVYHISIDWLLMFTSGLISVLISFLTISYIALKITNATPITVLRSE